MICFAPVRITKNLNRRDYPDGLEVPCGKCVGCRIARRKEWSMRMLHELDSWDSAVFVTLTYNDEHLPENSSLVKEDLQKFFKRLRKRLDNKTVLEELDYYVTTGKMEHKIKYFACGEYGEDSIYLKHGQLCIGTARPHYHAIIFGLSLRPEDTLYVMEAWPYCDWNNMAIVKGSFGLAEPDSINYVAQYIDKKLSGDLAKQEYDEKGRIPVFRLLSLGLGKKFVMANAQQLLENERITLFGVEQSFPRYYIKKLGLENSTFRKEQAVQKNMDSVKYYTGIDDLTYDEAYHVLTPETVRSLVEGIKKERLQKEKNIKAKIKIKESRKTNLTM